MDMRRILFTLTTVALCAYSCMREPSAVHPVSEKSPVKASIEQMVGTKTYLDDMQVNWSDGDRIVIFAGTSSGSIYKVSPQSAGSTYAQFTYEGDLPGYGSYAMDDCVAVYPMNESAGCQETSSGDYKIAGLSLPSRQLYQEESFADESFLMTAVRDKDSDEPYSFRNVCGGLKLQLYGDCSVREIEVQGNNGELLSGNVYITASPDGEDPVMTFQSGASKKTVLDCGSSGVRLKKSEVTDFIISLPPVVFTKGFNVIVRDVLGREMMLNTSKTNTVLRSSLLKMPAATFSVIPADQDVIYSLDKNHCSATYAEIDITFGEKCQTAFHYTMKMDAPNADKKLEGARTYYEGDQEERRALAQYLSSFGFSLTPSAPGAVCDTTWVEYALEPDTEYIIAYCCTDSDGNLSEVFFSEPFWTKPLNDDYEANKSDISLEFSEISRTSLKFNFSYDPENTAVLKFICIKNTGMDLHQAYGGEIDIPSADASQKALHNFFDEMANSLFMNVWPKSASGSDTYTLVGLEPGSEIAYAYMAEDMDGILSEVKIAEAVMKEDKPGPDPEVRIDPVWDPATRTWTVTFSMVKDCSKFKYTLNCDDNMFLARLGTGDMRAYEFYNHWDSFVTAYGLETSYDSVTATSVPDEDHVALAVSWGKNAEDKDVVSGLEYIILTKDGQMMKISDYYPSYIEK